MLALDSRFYLNRSVASIDARPSQELGNPFNLNQQRFGDILLQRNDIPDFQLEEILNRELASPQFDFQFHFGVLQPFIEPLNPVVVYLKLITLEPGIELRLDRLNVGIGDAEGNDPCKLDRKSVV